MEKENYYDSEKVKSYIKYKESPICFDFQAANVKKMIGSLKGKNIIDFACGSGFYTRILKELDANIIIGLDISPSQIDFAKMLESKKPQGIEYLVHDCKKPFQIPPQYSMEIFNVATAFYLFNYSENYSQLLEFCSSAYSTLSKEGRFVGYLFNPYIYPCNNT